VLKSIALLPNYSFCPFSSTPFPCPHLLLPFSPNMSPPTHLPPAEQPTVPTLHNPNALQSLTQALYTTTTEIHPNTHKGHKSQHSPLHLPHLTTPVLASLLVPP
jgi:hypothetical protein